MPKKTAEDTEPNGTPVAEKPIEVSLDAPENGSMVIDYFPTVYDKTLQHKLGTGYARRPNADAILGIVLHTTKGEFIEEAGRLARATKEGTHYLIGTEREGVVPVAMIVPPFLMTSHAGPSMGHGYYDWDHISVGVTVLTAADQPTLTVAQWKAVEWLVALLKRHYPSIQWVVKHSMIAQTETPVDSTALGPDEEFTKWAAKH